MNLIVQFVSNEHLFLKVLKRASFALGGAGIVVAGLLLIELLRRF